MSVGVSSIARMTYDTSSFIDPVPRVPGFHDANCLVRWTWNSPNCPAEVTIRGTFLDGDGPCGAITLGCGIEEALDGLGISDLLDYDHILAVCDVVDRQLATRPWAEVKCRQGTARIELVPLAR